MDQRPVRNRSWSYLESGTPRAIAAQKRRRPLGWNTEIAVEPTKSKAAALRSQSLGTHGAGRTPISGAPPGKDRVGSKAEIDAGETNARTTSNSGSAFNTREE
jgi:hypothetical protein